MIVPMTISQAVISIFMGSKEHLNGLFRDKVKELVQGELVDIDKYLWGHPDLFQKRFIFFVVNNSANEWLGFTAINPWVQLVKVAAL